MAESSGRPGVVASIAPTLYIAGGLFLSPHAFACPGDCDGDGEVTVNEVVAASAVALGIAPREVCLQADVNGDGEVTVDELLLALETAVIGCVRSPPVPLDPVFVDVTEAAGVTYVQRPPGPREDCFRTPASREQHVAAVIDCWLAPQSGGAAAGDYDNDGWPDLYVTRIDGPGILFRNNGDGTFTDVTEEAGLGGAVNGNGAAWGDIDNDGDLDLYVTTIGETRNYLFINDGQGRFTEEAELRGADVFTGEVHFGQGVAFGDYDRDGWIDLYTTEWRFWDFSPGFEGSHSRLLRNCGAEAPGYFEDVTVEAGVDLDRLFGFGVATFAPAFVDLDGDGWQELALASDLGTSRLFWNNGDGTFTDGTVAAGVGTDENGMGSAFGDYDGDGHLDWFVTSISCEPPFRQSASCSGNRLYRYEGGRRFSDQTDAAGVRIGHWGWGAVFFDHDNDGDLDLAMVNGSDHPGVFQDDPYHEDPMRFWRNDGTGVLAEMSGEVGLTDTALGKGILAFDYDNDGDLDLFITNTGGYPRLYRNDGGNSRDWLRVRVIGGRTNRDGYGVRVSVTVQADGPVQVREIGASSHYLGQSEQTAHFGLGTGADPVAAVRIEWPASGQVQTFEGVRRNTTLEVIEPTAGVVPDREGPLPVVSNPARKKLTTKGTRNRPRIVSDRSS